MSGTPFERDPATSELAECADCGCEFDGNFLTNCPECGSATREFQEDESRDVGRRA